jgi:hypothetical protein
MSQHRCMIDQRGSVARTMAGNLRCSYSIIGSGGVNLLNNVRGLLEYQYNPRRLTYKSRLVLKYIQVPQYYEYILKR